MRRRLAICAIVLATLWLLPASAWACTCLGGMPACQALWLGGEAFTPTVFEGTVVAITEETHPAVTSDRGLHPYLRVTFRDVRTWIGDSTGSVATELTGAACGYSFERGRRYVVHATTNPATGDLRTGLCSQTRPIEEAEELLAYVRTLSGAARGGLVFGSAALDRGRFAAAASAPSAREPLAGVRVRLSGATERESVTAADGSYRFDALPVGDYAIAAELEGRPELAVAQASPRPIRIANDRSCARVDLSFAVNGVIAGTLVDQSGAPIPHTIVNIRLETPLGGDRPAYGMTPTDALGRFEFSRLPAARYVVGIALERGPDRGSPWAPARSDVVELEPGELRTISPLVTRRLVPTRVRGAVIDAAGRPVAGQRVTAHPVTDLGQEAFGGAAVTDADGVFEMELLEGQPYTFSVAIGTRRASSAAIVAGHQAPTIRVPAP